MVAPASADSLGLEFDLASLQAVLDEPIKWWKLHVDETGIKVASVWERAYQWILSFFTSSHKQKLCGALQSIVETRMLLNNEQRIAIEKIVFLKFYKKGVWFEDLPVPNLPPIFRVDSKITDPSLLRPHREGGRYYNYPGEKIWKQFFETLRLLFVGALRKPSEENLKTWYRTEWTPCSRSEEPKITWLGHAGILLQVANFNILFDPSFQFVPPCFRRHTPPPISFERLPKIDVLAISHNHADHLEPKTVKKLADHQPVAFVPQGTDHWFVGEGYRNVVGNEWWSQTTLTRDGRSIKLTAIPAQHGSQVGVRDLNCDLWMGIMVEADGKKYYFAGDTAFNPKIFDDVKKQFGTIDVAFLPIAPEGEESVHLDHIQALEVFERLGAKSMVPIHWGAYRTGKEQIEEPIRKFEALLSTERWSSLKDKICRPKLGETVTLGSRGIAVLSQAA